MTPKLRRALTWSPLLLAALVGTEACGARSFLSSDTQARAGTGGAGGAGGAATVSSSTGFDPSTTIASTSVTTSSSSGVTTSSSSSSSGTGGTGGTVNPIISDSPGSFLQSETSVVAGPNGVVAVAWIDLDNTGVSTIGYTFSTDDGATFAPPTQIQSPGNRVASDPLLAIDAMGNIYVTWVAFHTDAQGNPNSMRIYVSRADAGGTTFGTPIRVSAQGDTASFDKPWITATNGGALLLTYERNAMPNDYSVVAARSNDGGMTWQRTPIADDATGMVFRNLAFPCAPKDGGHVWVTYLAETGLGIDVRLARSDDGGATWSSETIVSQANEQVSFDDPTCAAENDQVWIAYGLTHDMTDPKATKADKAYSIQLVHSNDAGQSFDTRLEAADPAAGAFFQHPFIALEDAGVIDVVYYAGQDDLDPAGSYRRARQSATQPGNGFDPSVVVEAPVTFLQARDDQRWLGDYTGLFWRGGELYMSYVTNASGTAHIAFTRATVP